jgi:formate dehydrogenase major subunit
MTNHWIDLRNSDCIMIIGSNAAENHPISFKWITAAKERGAKLISVDPRFTRTSSKADIYAPMRSGCDITFIGGMRRYILNDMQTLSPAKRAEDYNMTYVAEYTNAAFIVNSGFESWDDTAHPGVFVGFTENTNAAPSNLGGYDKSNWGYANKADPTTDSKVVNNTWNSFNDLNPNCVLRLLWENFQDYTPEKVSEVTGCPVETFNEVCKEYAATGAPGKAGTIMYAMGTTQHTYGTQNIRGYAILQLLLGNIGVAGGGINALRGTSNVQGSTDMCLLSHILPGYLAMVNHKHQSLADYISGNRAAKLPATPSGLAGDTSASWWWLSDAAQNYKKYMVSLLKAWWMDKATADNDFCFNYLPKVTVGHNYTHIGTFEAVANGTVKGMMVWGQNPAVAGPDSEGERKALEKLDWLMVCDLFETETSSFWKRPEASPSSINTEVFLLPAACSYEKQGSISNSGRWAQWRYKAVAPVGEAKSDLAIMDELMLKLKEKYAAESGATADPINDLYWDYHTAGEYAFEADPNVVAKEIHGYYTKDAADGSYSKGDVVTNFVSLQTDGSTCSGNWLYSGMFDKGDGRNKAKDRKPEDTSLNQIGLYSGWSWCWPINRRIIYNRASVDLEGQPWDSDHPVVSWIEGAWKGDVPDGGWAPINVAADGAKYLPFIMQTEGVAHIWGPGLAEGPVPVAYEPWESPLSENLVTGVSSNGSGKGTPGFHNPCSYIGELNGMNKRGTASEYPCVGMTYRVSEMWQAGQMTRNHPWLIELQPEVFAEMGEELASDKGIKSGDKVRVSTARGYVDAVAIVTKRLQRMTIGGKKVDQVGVPWHYGYIGMASAPHSSGNILTPHVGDANTTIPEYKTFLCKVQKI